MPDLNRITGAVRDRAALHMASGIFQRIDPRFQRKMAELLAYLQVADQDQLRITEENKDK